MTRAILAEARQRSYREKPVNVGPVSLSLPYPPSANRLWRAVNGRQIKSAEYRAWIDEAALSIRLQRPRGIVGAYHLVIRASRPDRRRRDIDNLLKPIWDALCQGGVVGDDCDCEHLTAFWSNGVVKGGAIDVQVMEA